ncbi:hypothetical protein LTR74_016916 [Friedmanniomyces endolithicus]|nr:hypothetical protein LTR74_016916 [Friedmanniomyces endolithicus]
MKWRWIERQWKERPKWIDNARIQFLKLQQRYEHLQPADAPGLHPYDSTPSIARNEEEGVTSDEEDHEALKWPGNMMTEQLYQYNTARRSARKLRFADSLIE